MCLTLKTHNCCDSAPVTVIVNVAILIVLLFFFYAYLNVTGSITCRVTGSIAF